MDLFPPAADPDIIASERRKAKLLKQSAWWKNVIGKGICSYCGLRFSPRELTMDHKTPLIHGGRSSRSNCVPACFSCNQQKKNLPAEVWRTTLANLSSKI